MKNLKLIGFLMILASSLMFIQCTTDTLVGPAGADGTNGIDGVNGINGVDGVDGVDGVNYISCETCHSNSHRAPIEASYLLSTHSKSNLDDNGKTLYERYGGRSYCGPCHSNEQFVNYVTGSSLSLSNPTAIGCTTCHSKHGTFDFVNDGNDYALRTFEPVTLGTDATVTIDYGDKSNLCINCHQSRSTGPVDDNSGFFLLDNGHWGPHHGPQANMLEGIQGAEIAGSTSYSGLDGNGPHRTGIGEAKSSCVVCHMDETSDGTDGAHSWLTTGNACLSCHGSVPTAVTGLAADMTTLAGLIENTVGWEYKLLVKRDGAGEPILDDGDFIWVDASGIEVDDPIKELDGSGNPIKVDVHAILHDGHPNVGYYGEGATFTFVVAQAAWNYIFVMEDMSGGVHNPGYTRALIKNSIEALQ